MFVYDVSVTFVLEKCSITAGVQVESDNPDFEIDENLAIDAARDSLEYDGLDVPEPLEISVEIQGLYGGM